MLVNRTKPWMAMFLFVAVLGSTVGIAAAGTNQVKESGLLRDSLGSISATQSTKKVELSVNLGPRARTARCGGVFYDWTVLDGHSDARLATSCQKGGTSSYTLTERDSLSWKIVGHQRAAVCDFAVPRANVTGSSNCHFWVGGAINIRFVDESNIKYHKNKKVRPDGSVKWISGGLRYRHDL